MAFKDVWKPRIDGVDDADVSAVNEIAEAVIKNEEAVEKNAKDISNKVPKEQGKGLSTNDYTDEEKEKVSKIGDKADKTYVDNTFANALKGTASGTSFRIEDISPIEHTLDVKVKSKNAGKYSNKTISGDKSYASGTVLITLLPNTDYAFSADFEQTGSAATVGVTIRNINGTTIGKSETTSNLKGRLAATFTTPTDGKINVVYFSNITPTAIAGTSCTYSKVQIEEGGEATDYTPYVEDVAGYGVAVTGADESYNEYFAGTDGVIGELVSTYPSMGFTAIASSGAYANNVVADVTYNKDINKAFKELEQKLTNAVISLGGNV